MNDELKNLENIPAPKLTLNPVAEQVAEAEAEMRRMEAELRQKLLEVK